MTNFIFNKIYHLHISAQQRVQKLEHKTKMVSCLPLGILLIDHSIAFSTKHLLRLGCQGWFLHIWNLGWDWLHSTLLVIYCHNLLAKAICQAGKEKLDNQMQLLIEEATLLWLYLTANSVNCRNCKIKMAYYFYYFLIIHLIRLLKFEQM